MRGIKRVQAECVSPPVHVNFSHCARFVFLSRAIDETDPRLVLVAALMLPYQPLLHVPGWFPCTNAIRSSV